MGCERQYDFSDAAADAGLDALIGLDFHEDVLANQNTALART